MCFCPQFGGGKSTGFGVIYDDKKAALQFEPKYRLIRVRTWPIASTASSIEIWEERGEA